MFSVVQFRNNYTIRNNLEIDYDSLEKHINFLTKGGIGLIVSCGTTRGPLIRPREHKRVTEFIIKNLIKALL